MITVYGYPSCPYCENLKELYKKEGIEYRDVNIELEENVSEWETVSTISKAEQVPLIKIDRQLLVPNVSFKTIEEAVEITKRFLS